MSKTWSKARLKAARLGQRKGIYKAFPKTHQEEMVYKSSPEIFEFEAMSIGDDTGQAFIVPLDESSEETARFILRAIAAYKGD